jgi:hypothetical protein
MPLEKRQVLFDNARRKDTPEARALIDLLVEHDLLVGRSGGLPRHHPVIAKIEDIIRSPEGRARAKDASDQGLPAMAGVDPLLAAQVGSAYGTYDTTSWAGTFVAEEMELMGYKQTRKKPLPEGCVARTAAYFEKRR